MSHLLPRFHATTERMEDERKIGRVLLDGGEIPEPEKNPRRQLVKPGDPRVLRAIPVIARGVAGCIPGTEPYGAFVLSERMR
jgi:hypothetical protein